MFKNHLEMIGRNESPSKKAKFWQSYVRSLKGSEDIRAHETPTPRSYRPYSSAFENLPTWRSIYDEASAPGERIQSSGYRYLPVHRETYGYSPRPIYDHHYSRTIDLFWVPANYDVERAWNEHLKRMQDIERRYPSRYGLYLKDKPSASVPLLEYEPEDKIPDRVSRSPSVLPLYRLPRGMSQTPARGDRAKTPACDPLQPVLPYRSPSVARACSVPPRASSLPRFSDRELSPFRSWSPLRASSVDPFIDAINRLPIWHPRNRFRSVFDPSPNLPISAITRDPFWWDLADLAPIRPSLGFWPTPLVRDSFLSPVKRRYLWTRHPIRPFAHN